MATEKCGCGAIVYYVAPGTGPVLCESCAETALRADERAKVEREVVADLLRQALSWEPSTDDDKGEERAVLTLAAERVGSGKYRPKPGQPKEGGK